MQKQDRWDYIMSCQDFNAKALRCIGPVLIEYVRGRRRRKEGVVLATRDGNGSLCVGYSKCNTRADVFNKDVGIYKALNRLTPVQNLLHDKKVPQSVRSPLNRMIGRAIRYFSKEQVSENLIRQIQKLEEQRTQC